MRVVDEDCLKLFREKPRCELCGRALYARAHPHHIHSRGAGRLDIPINLISLGGYVDCNCHGAAHAGKVTRDALQAIAARREGVTVEAAIDEVHRIRRADKNGEEPRRRGI